MHEADESKAHVNGDDDIGLGADIDDAEFDTFMTAVREMRTADKLQIGDD